MTVTTLGKAGTKTMQFGISVWGIEIVGWTLCSQAITFFIEIQLTYNSFKCTT